MKVTYPGLQRARARLQLLADNLRDAAGGEVVSRAAEKVQALISRVAGEKAGRHVDTGAALASIAGTTSGGLIQLRSLGYLRFHRWWPFRRGMPNFVVKYASRVFADELLAAIGGSAAARASAAQVVIEQETEEATRRAKTLARQVERASRSGLTRARRAVERQQKKIAKERQSG